MKKLLVLFLILFLFQAVRYSLFASSVLAHCPLCVAGAGAGLTLARWIGVDDSITGIWLGALMGAISFWSERAIISKFKIQSASWRAIFRISLYIAIFGLTLASFYQFNLVNKLYQIFGMDKLTFGMIGGGVLFYLVDLIDDYLIKRNGKVFFPYQRIIVSLGSMALLSLVQYYLINYVI